MKTCFTFKEILNCASEYHFNIKVEAVPFQQATLKTYLATFSRNNDPLKDVNNWNFAS